MKGVSSMLAACLLATLAIIVQGPRPMYLDASLTSRG